MDHHDHMIRVAYRGMLDAVCQGTDLTRKSLRGLKFNGMEEYATTIAANLQGKM